MKPSCLALILLIAGWTLQGADSKQDSLLAVYSNASASDSLRFDALESLVQVQPDSAGQYLAWMEKMALESNDPVIRIKAGRQKARLLQKNGDLSQAEEVLRDGLAYALDQPDVRAHTYARMFLADLLTETGKMDEAKNLYEQALKDAKSEENEGNQVLVLLNLGALHLNEGDFPEALEVFFQIIRLLENIRGVYSQKDQQLASATNNVAIVYARMGELPKARTYFEKALLWSEKAENQSLAANITGNIAYLYYLEGSNDSAIEFGLRAVEKQKRLGNNSDLASTLSNIGAAYEKKGDGEQALWYYGQSLAMFETLGNASGVQRLLMSIGSYYQVRGNLKEAAAYSERAYDLARQSGFLDNEKELAMRLYEIYEARGQYQQALAMHVQYMSLRDSIYNDEARQALLRYEYQEKALKDSLAYVQKAAASDLDLAQQKSLRNASLGGMGFAAILAGLLFVSGRRRRKTNLLLSAQKAEIELKSDQNELLLKEIHHRVKNSLQTISSLLHLQSAHIKDEDVRQAVAEGQHRVESMALIHQKLYQRDNLAAIEMRDYLQHLVQSLIDTFDADPERIRFDLDMPELELDVDTAVPLGLIVNELITNSLKYAFPKGRSGIITVSLTRKGEGLELFVGDNGAGKTTTSGGTSFGSQLVKLLTVQLGGKLEQGTEQGFWTKVRV